MGAIRDFLSRDINFHQTKRDKWNLVIFMTVFVPLFLLIFQPFGVNNFDPTHSISRQFFFSMIGFGLVQGFVLYVYEFGVVPLLFPNRQLWLFGIRMVIELVLIAFVTFLYYNVLGNFHDWRFSSFIDFIFNVGLMSIIPIAIIFLYSSYRSSKEAVKTLELQPKLDLNEKYVSFISSNGKEQLTLTLTDLLFIESQDNYIEINYLDNGSAVKKLLRAKMKDLDSDLQKDFIVRCHRSYMVNLHAVERVTRDAHQMKLYLPAVPVPVPVSRSYIPVLDQLLDIRHK